MKLLAIGIVPLAAAACTTVETKPEWGTNVPFEVTSSVTRGAADLRRQVVGLAAGDPALPLATAAANMSFQGPQGDPGKQGGKAAGKMPQGQGISEDEKAGIRSRFGSAVLIADDGSVTKQYFLTGEAGGVFLNLLKEPGAEVPMPNAPLRAGGDSKSRSVLGRMLGEHVIEARYIENFEIPEGLPIRKGVKDPGNTALTPAPLVGTVKAPVGNHLVLVTAKAEDLGAFESALGLFFSSIPQVEIEVKVVEYAANDSLAIGLSAIGTSPTLNNLSSDKLIKSYTGVFPLTPSLAGASASDRGSITLGGIHDSWELAAQLDLLETRGIADILSNPKMAVRNGGIAQVITTTQIPYPAAKITSTGQNIVANIVFKPVGITLNIRPVIAGTNTVILQVHALVSTVTDFAATDPVPTPIISSREVVTQVHVSDGKTTVIGGLVATSKFDQVSKVPILGDIPILGYLFRSTTSSKRERTLEFHITPRILQGPRGFTGG